MATDDLRTALLDAVSSDEPPVGPGPAAVFTRAARVRARRRFLAGSAGVAAVALVAAVVVQVAGGRPQRAPSDGVAAPPPSAVPSTGDPAGGLNPVEMRADDVLATLRRLLPPTVTPTEPYGQDGYAEFVLVDAAGKSKVKLNVQANFATDGKDGRPLIERYSCETSGRPAGTTCTSGNPGGPALVIGTDGPSEDAGHDNIRLRQVDTYYPDIKLRVVIGVWNAVDVKSNTATRSEPSLTVDQLLAIAADPAWRTK
jgi:hypothetical protein